VSFPLANPTKTCRPAARATTTPTWPELVAAFRPDLIVLAGWMLILGPAFLGRFPRRVINLHPALPGQFAGTHAIQRAYDAFQRGEIDHTGVMVHWVVPQVDAGPVLASVAVPIYPTDSLDDLETRMHGAEHRLLVEAIAQIDLISTLQ
jgi:formyltetrahydrofolate-dependent phosphoribosylglycinamide formyltransferase